MLAFSCNFKSLLPLLLQAFMLLSSFLLSLWFLPSKGMDHHRSSLVPSNPGKRLPPPPPFSFVPGHHPPVITNIGKPVNNALLQNPWHAPSFFGNLGNNPVVNTRHGNVGWDGNASFPSRMEMIINSSQVNAIPFQQVLQLGEGRMIDDFQTHFVQENPNIPQPMAPQMHALIPEQQFQVDLGQPSSGVDLCETGVLKVSGFCNASPDSVPMAASVRDDAKEKMLERRQRRMLKNRESATRSRAKKQAYIHELEKKVHYLRRMNEWLKKAKQLLAHSTPEPIRNLRRCNSAQF